MPKAWVPRKEEDKQKCDQVIEAGIQDNIKDNKQYRCTGCRENMYHTTFEDISVVEFSAEMRLELSFEEQEEIKQSSMSKVSVVRLATCYRVCCIVGIP